MILSGPRTPLLLFAGDLLAFALSLYLTLAIRAGALPGAAALAPYLLPFSVLFALWLLVFYSAGLYSKRLLLFPNRLPDALFKTQAVNIIFAALFFFFIPTFGIAPKIILALYFIVSLGIISLWRLVLYPRLSRHHSREEATLIAEGPEADALYTEVNSNPRYGILFTSHTLEQAPENLLVIDKKNIEAIPDTGAPFGRAPRPHVIAFEDLYEEVFDRVPLSRLGHAWFRDNVSLTDPLWYRIAKRVIDILGGLLMGLVTLIVAPFILIANFIEGPGPLFLEQERFGTRGERIRVYKFRSMQKNLQASGQWVGEGENRITRVGSFLRKSSLDEFPQFINVIKGELSLIGPRSDILGLGLRLAEALPYYEARYTVVPGITGWAQINQQYEQGHVSPQSIEETKVRLAYDFYYLKHRSLGLDLIIALKTFKRMFFRVSSW